jgi:glycosyltransferase involved in cell wall biosynthesis
MNVLIYEPDFAGHRLTGVRVLLEALLELGRLDVAITVALGEGGRESKPFEVQLAALANRFKLRTVPYASRGSVRGDAQAKARALVDLLRAGQFQHIYMPYADGVTQVLGVRGLVPFSGYRFPKDVVGEGLTMRGGYAYPGASRGKSWATLTAYGLSPWKRIHLIDPIPFRWIRKNKPGLLRKASLLADPIDTRPGIDRATARRNLGLPESGRLVGCVGMIDQRKGGDLLVKAFASAKLNEDDRLLLGGKQDAAVKQVVAQLDPAVRSRVIEFDRYLSEDELHWATCALDLMATPYPGFIGSASIVIRAAVAGRRVLAADTGWMGYVVPKFGLGRVVNVFDHAKLARAIEEELPLAVTHVAPESARQLASFYSIDNVRAGWTSLIRERLGMPQREGRVNWPDSD